jgi:hypothetical protein
LEHLPGKWPHHLGLYYCVVSDAILPSFHPCNYCFSAKPTIMFSWTAETISHVCFDSYLVAKQVKPNGSSSELIMCRQLACITKISSRIRWPTSPSPPRPTADIIILIISLYCGYDLYRFWSRSVNLSCAWLISLHYYKLLRFIEYFGSTNAILSIIQMNHIGLSICRGYCHMIITPANG